MVHTTPPGVLKHTAHSQHTSWEKKEAARERQCGWWWVLPCTSATKGWESCVIQEGFPTKIRGSFFKGQNETRMGFIEPLPLDPNNPWKNEGFSSLKYGLYPLKMMVVGFPW